MTFIKKAGVLLRDPSKLLHFCQYSSSRLFYGDGIARIPWAGRIRTSSFSEYLSVYGLMPTVGELAMIRKLVSPATEVFDVGANVGVWTVLMSKANPQARIHTFEPNPGTYALLERNTKQNGCSKVLLNHAAVSNSTGTLTFEVPKNASIFGRIAPTADGYDPEGRFSNADSFKVSTIRLAEYCQAKSVKEVDFLKIDIEGHELAALKGLEPFLGQRKVKAFYMETIKENHDRMGTKFSELLGFIADCGYHFYTLNENGDPGDRVPIDQIKAHNHLCLPG